jgi:hypothetical protein
MAKVPTCVLCGHLIGPGWYYTTARKRIVNDLSKDKEVFVHVEPCPTRPMQPAPLR